MSHPTDPAGPSSNVLDVGVFQDLLESLQSEAAAAVYRKFIESAATFIDELRTQDAAARIETFHTLKGSAAMMGANRMSDLAARLQAQDSSVQIDAAVEQLAGELEQFRAAVAGKLVALGGSLDTPR
jgi:HPt (histidine-containing phosphotransfer) domain-containing protein